MMIAQLMVQPSSFMSFGIQLSQFGEHCFFRFTNELQSRLEELLEKKKADLLMPKEETELAGISELSRIFTLINAQIATQTRWCPLKRENLYDHEPDTCVNTVIPQST